MKERPLILVTNDDGFTAPGIKALTQMMLPLGDVVVVAPESPQSGMGHAVTINATLYLNKIRQEAGAFPIYSCSGTPVDCVKLAVNEILGKKPDICVSGINHGGNASINVLYSGTMSAAVEAGIEGIPAIGFSMLDYNWDADFSHTRPYVLQLVSKVLVSGLPKGVVLNVNFPKDPIKGVRICRQAKGYWIEQIDKRTNPQGKEYYWLTGDFITHETDAESDWQALKDGYASIVPVQFDLTAYQAMNDLKKWSFENE